MFQEEGANDECGKHMPRHVSNMWKHLATLDFTNEKAQAQPVTATNGLRACGAVLVTRPT